MEIPVLVPWLGWNAIPERAVVPYRYLPTRAVTPYRNIPVRAVINRGPDVKRYFDMPMRSYQGFGAAAKKCPQGSYWVAFSDKCCPMDSDPWTCSSPDKIYDTGFDDSADVTGKGECDVPIFQKYDAATGKCKPDWLKIGIAAAALAFATTILK